MLPRRTITKSAPPVSAKVQVALPYQAPQDGAAQLQRLRRRCVLLTWAVGGLLVVAVAAVVYLRSASAGLPGENGSARDEDRSIKLADATTKPGDRPAPKPVPEIREVVAPAKLAFPTLSPEARGREPLLETIGGLAAIHLYQSYLNIGLLADAVESETYTRAEASSIMLTVTELINLADQQLNKVPAAGLASEDETALEAVRLLTSLLRTQSNALLSFWASGDEAHAERYQTARERSWTALRMILGIGEE